MSKKDDIWNGSRMRVMHVLAERSRSGSSGSRKGRPGQEAGIDVVLRHAQGREPAGYGIRKEGPKTIVVEGVKWTGDHGYDQKLREAFDALFKKYRPRIVHIHVSAGFSLLPVLNTASSLKIRKVLTLHDDLLIGNGQAPRGEGGRGGRRPLRGRPGRPSLPPSPGTDKRVKCILDQSDAVICSSGQQKKRLEGAFGRDRKFISAGAARSGAGAVYRQVLNKKSRSLYFKLGLFCNSNCLYCVSDVAAEPFIDLRVIKRVLEEKAAVYDRIILSGGEPALHPRFPELLAVIFYLGYKIMVQSNARAFSRPRIAAGIKKYNAKVVVSLNSSREEVFDVMADVPGAFRQTVRGVRNLIGEGVEVDAKIIITKHNYDHLGETVRFVKGSGINDVLLVFPTPMGAALKNFPQVVPRYADVLPAVHDALRWGLDHGMEMSVENIPACLLDERYHGCNHEYAVKGSLDGIYVRSPKGLYNCRTERVVEQKLKLRGCKRCRHSPRCEGIYRQYLDNYGPEEFRAVQGGI